MAEEHIIVQNANGELMFKKILQKLRLKKEEKYPNRFLKFYHLNKKKLIQERKGNYYSKKQSGICVRCHRPALSEIIFCVYHQEKQKGYNMKARNKKVDS